MVEVAFNGKYKPVFLIDNSPIHKYLTNCFLATFSSTINYQRTMPDDALNARAMNVRGTAKPCWNVYHLSLLIQMVESSPRCEQDGIGGGLSNSPNTWCIRCYKLFIWIMHYYALQDGEKKGIAKGLRTVVGERFGPEAVEGYCYFICRKKALRINW